MIIVIIIIVILLWMLITYNSLIDLKNKVRDEWGQIDILLKRRYELVPSLVEAVKGYASYEKETFDAVVNARECFNNSNDVVSEINASNMLNKAVNRVILLKENYPDLNANNNFMQLSASLKDAEDKIAYARQFYNEAVLRYNNKIEKFPSNLIACMFKFEKGNFFEV